MTQLPTGTVTFLFTDIEGSTRLLNDLGEAYAGILADQRAILRAAFEHWNGQEIDTQGDAFFAVFPRAVDAIAAVVDAQRALAHHPWPPGATVRVRMALHTGEPTIGPTGYVGIDVHRAARIVSAGHGGQVLISAATRGIVENDLPAGVTLLDLGEHRLKDLQKPERIYQLVIADLPSDFPPLKSLDALPNNLPIQLTSFVGREDTIAEIKRLLLAPNRLLTLTGTGGTGKTRLSLQVAAELLDAFPDGVWLIELAQLTDPALIPQSMAATLGVPELPGRPLMAALSDFLRDKTLLLILDNCEHLIEACAQLANTFLRTCPHLKILASSREALGIAGEIAFRVPSLSLPAAAASPADLEQSESARLFVERAAAVQPHFAVTLQNAPQIAQVCQRLDGIPLALELAAARVNVLTVDQIAARLNDRFRLLTGGSRTALPRQQTLRAAIDWSYDLLSDPERVLLRRQSVFLGGWDLSAAEAVCGSGDLDVLDLLSHLVAKSLVVVDESGQSARYRMLEMVRQYARDKLLESGEGAQVRDRHLEFFSALARQAEPGLDGPEVRTWLDRLELEHDNLRAALEWGLEANPDAALEMAGHLAEFWGRRGYGAEGRRWLDEAETRVKVAPPLEDDPAARRRLAARAKALASWGRLAIIQGDDQVRTREKLAAGLALARQSGDEQQIAFALRVKGMGDIFVGDFSDAGPAIEESLALSRKIGDRVGVARSVGFTAQLLMRGRHDFAGGLDLLSEAMRMERDAGMVYDMATAQIGQAYVALYYTKNYPKARTLFTEMISASESAGDERLVNAGRSGLAEVARLEGDYDQSLALYQTIIRTWQGWGHRGSVARCLECFAFIANAQGQDGRAARLLGAANALREVSDAHMTPEEVVEYGAELAALRAKIDPAAFDAAWAEGRAMSMEQAVEYAIK